MRSVVIIISSLLIFSCAETETTNYVPKPVSCPHPEINLKPITIGDFSFYVPATFRVRWQDSLNMPGVGYFITDEGPKFFFNASTVGTAEILNEKGYKDYSLSKDTAGGVLRLIAFSSDPEPKMEIHVARKGPDLGQIGMEDYNVDYIFNAMTDMGVGNKSCLTKKELDIFLFSVMNGSVLPR